jgi:hypothetical protein
MGKIVVDRGLEEYTIEDKNGTVLGKFEMNPADVELVKRYEHVAEAVSHIADDVDESKDIVDIVKEMEEKLNKQIDYLFNSNVSQSFFSITSPFTVLSNGEFFVENVLNAIGSLIKVETGKRFEKVHTKIGKYTSKYHK